MLRGEEIHGESITDGDSSGGIAVTLYKSGTVTERTLAATEILYITDVQIYNETGGDTWLCADGKVDGEYVAHANLAANGGIILHFNQPRACAKGTGLVFFGAGTNIGSCVIEGFIQGA